ncbi:hypothetical protein DFQ28_006776 [Apophysomyces sp. BC1034]|nr:hypothetical protein DFQ28_006776 [Apophysomyces sp. BC1034]
MSKQDKASDITTATTSSFAGQTKKINFDDTMTIDEIGYPQSNQKHTTMRHTEEELDVAGPTKSPPPVLMPRPVPAVIPTRNLFQKNGSPLYVSQPFSYISYRETEATNEEKTTITTSITPAGILKNSNDNRTQSKKDTNNNSDLRQNNTTLFSTPTARAEKRPASSWKIVANTSSAAPKVVSPRTDETRQRRPPEKSSDDTTETDAFFSQQQLMEENARLKHELKTLIHELEEVEHDRLRMHHQNCYMAAQLRQLEQKMHDYTRCSTMEPIAPKRRSGGPGNQEELHQKDKEDLINRQEKSDRESEFIAPVQSSIKRDEESHPVRPVPSSSEPVRLRASRRHSIHDPAPPLAPLRDNSNRDHDSQMLSPGHGDRTDPTPFSRRLRRRMPLRWKYYDVEEWYPNDEFFMASPVRQRNFNDITPQNRWNDGYYSHAEEDNWNRHRGYGYEIDPAERWEERQHMTHARHRPITRQKSWTSEFNKAARSGSLTRRRSVSSTSPAAGFSSHHPMPPPHFAPHDMVWPEYGVDPSEGMMYPPMPPYYYSPLLHENSMEIKNYPPLKQNRSIRRRPSGREMREHAFGVYGSSMRLYSHSVDFGAIDGLLPSILENNILDIHKAETLATPPSEEELSNLIKHIALGKSPGLDGLPFELYQFVFAESSIAILEGNAYDSTIQKWWPWAAEELVSTLIN